MAEATFLELTLESFSTKLLSQLASRYFDSNSISLTALKGDGSDRKIFLIRDQGRPEQSVVGVYHANLQENNDFIQITKKMQEAGIPVPEIYRVDNSGQAYLLRYLGDSNLGQCIDQWLQVSDRGKIEDAYKLVLPYLVKMQIRLTPLLSGFLQQRTMGRQDFTGDLAYFERDFINRFDFTDLFSPALHQELHGTLLDRITAIPPAFFVYRDFQSRNIMWLQDTPWFIDYQSAYLGTRYYDLASLLYASKSGLDDNTRENLLLYFYQIAGIELGFEEYRAHFYLFVLIRRLRSLGSYGFLAMAKSKTDFLNQVEPTLAELQLLLQSKTELKGFRHTSDLVNSLIERWQKYKW